jgi:predicted aconitase with swiveling domain
VTSAGWTVEARPLLAGDAGGPALVLEEALSFWGGVDAGTGRIVDAHHPQHRASITGRMLVLPSGRGSSSSSSVLAECLAAGTGPIAILLGEPDPILLVGALVAAELGHAPCPVVVIGDSRLRIGTGDDVHVTEAGLVTVRSER